MDRMIDALSHPAFVGRIAGIELRVAAAVLQGQPVTARDLAELENNAGIHTTSTASLRAYAQQLLAAYEACTLIAEWPTTGPVYHLTGSGQDHVRRLTPNIPKISALALEPYYVPPTKPTWIDALAHKRILIVHPFVHTFQAQIEHLRAVHRRPWLEGCTFQFVRPPVTLGGQHRDQDWSVALQPTLDALSQVEPFDVALVGAGGYGMLLSHHLYRTHPNSSVIYIGGALQLFFGVIGKRWFTQPEVMALVTSKWVRPLPADRPVGWERVERGCYW
jgi:hypothetical protein